MLRLKETSIGSRYTNTNDTILRQLIKINLQDDDTIKIFHVDKLFDVIVLFGNADVDSFTLPITDEIGHIKRVYVDIRRYCRKPKEGVSFEDSVKDPIFSNTLITAGVLAGHWEFGYIDSFGYNFRDGFTTFCALIANNITSLYHTSDADSALIRTLIAVMFTDISNPLSDPESQARITSIAKISRTDAYDIKVVLRVLNGRKVDSLEKMVAFLPEVTESHSLKMLNTQHITATTVKTINVIDNVFSGIAIEYPPYWLAIIDMVYIAGNSFKVKFLSQRIGGKARELEGVSKSIAILFGSSISERLKV